MGFFISSVAKQDNTEHKKGRQPLGNRPLYKTRKTYDDDYSLGSSIPFVLG